MRGFGISGMSYREERNETDKRKVFIHCFWERNSLKTTPVPCFCFPSFTGIGAVVCLPVSP